MSNQQIELDEVKFHLQMLPAVDEKMAEKLFAQLKEECQETGALPKDVWDRYRHEIGRGISPIEEAIDEETL